MPTMTDLAAVLFFVTFFLGLVAFMKAIASPEDRRSMGVRLHGDDEPTP